MKPRRQLIGFSLLACLPFSAKAELGFLKDAIGDAVRDHLSYEVQDFIDDHRNEWRYDGEYYYYQDRKYRKNEWEDYWQRRYETDGDRQARRIDAEVRRRDREIQRQDRERQQRELDRQRREVERQRREERRRQAEERRRQLEALRQ